MSQREITISSVNGLRIIIAQKLIATLNDHWNVAAFGRMSLNYKMVLHLVKVIKDCGHKIQSICQTQNDYVAWTKVKRKNHFCEDEDHPSAKLRKVK